MKLRNITSTVMQAIADTPVVLLNGARQTGKSTLAQMLPENEKRDYISLDDPSQLAAAKSDPRGFIDALSKPVVIDEIQHAPELLPCIKLSVDRDKRPGKFLLTGSADIMLLPQVSESLAGRMEIITMSPFSQGEMTGKRDDFIAKIFDASTAFSRNSKLQFSDYVSRIICGGYPAIFDRAEQSRRDRWYASYIASLLHKDIRQLFHVEGFAEFPRLLKLISSRCANIINASELSRSTAIPNTTLNRYLAVLQAMFIVRLLPAWSTNKGKRLVKAPKLFLNDTGLACHLLGCNSSGLGADKTLFGHMMENFVIAELLKQQSWSDMACDLFHFRTPTGFEVDVVLENAVGQIVGVEIKSAATVTPSDFKGLRALGDLAGKKFLRGLVFYTGSSLVSFSKEFQALPLSFLWD